MTRTPTNRRELINFRIRGIFAFIRDVLRYCNDIDIIALRLFGAAFGMNRTNIAKIPSQEYIYIRKYCTNQLRVIRKQVRIMYE